MERVMTGKAFMLLMKHRKIDDALRGEQRMRWPDPARVQLLKKSKLAIKDRLLAIAVGQRSPQTA
jgi:hypothetical protein